MISSISLLGVQVSLVNLSSASERIFHWVKAKEKTYICVAPAATLVDAKLDPRYSAVVNAAGMVTPDGVPVVWLARMKGARDLSRTYGPDLMRLICKEGQKSNLKHFLYGSTPETLLLLEKRLKDLYPQMMVVGTYSPAFRSRVEKEDNQILTRINMSKADILWVSLGSPKQDFWMALHRPLLEVPVMVGVGAAFDFLAGTKPQAPRWVQQCGLEWFFRFCCEPRRLWRRYLIGNLLFLYFALRELLIRK